jgi:PiT family inorganic phosphate transporter
VEVALVLAVALALAFDVTNGFHDSSNVVAALVATGAATPAGAITLAGTFHVLGPLLAGTAVADTVGGIVTVAPGDAVAVVGAALTGALVWNLLTWARGLPSSSSHALVGGLVGAAVASGGAHAVRWGGLDGLRPRGVAGVALALAISPVFGFVAGAVLERAARRGLRRARRRVTGPVRRAQWPAAAALAFSHGTNDAQKTMGIVTLLLLATGHLATFAVPLWVKLAAATALTIGTTLGGWRIARTVGSGIYRLRPLDGLVTESASAAVIFSAAALGGPVSTTHVVASSVVGAGAGHRPRRVRWRVVGEMGFAWLVTVPAAAAAGALAVGPWRWWA